MTTAREAFIPGDAFQSSSFDVEKYRPLEKTDRFMRLGNYAVSTDPNDPSFPQLTPRQALIRYAGMPVGAWQAHQRARYPFLHADLPLDLANIEDGNSEELKAFRHIMHGLIIHPERGSPHMIDLTHRVGDQAIDFHPIGHMAQTAMRLDYWLLGKASHGMPLDPFYLQVTRHTAALHDAGEAEFPGVRLHHGDALGDIGANVGKTSDEKALERSILASIMVSHFPDAYTSEFREAVVAMASHDTTDGETMKRHHDILEANHEINTIHTGIYLAKKAEQVAEELPVHANIMTALAFDSLLRGLKKRDKLLSADMSPILGTEITKHARQLFNHAINRDDDTRYTEWRTTDGAVKYFGEYNPIDDSVHAALANASD